MEKAEGGCFALFIMFIAADALNEEEPFCIIYRLLNYRLPHSLVGVVIDHDSVATKNRLL